VFGARFVMLAAWYSHSAALAADGAVWTWGKGDKGCLGHSDKQLRLTLTRLGKGVFGGSAAVLVACGKFHTMVVTADGELAPAAIGCSMASTVLPHMRPRRFQHAEA
jgi:alpha-tubulin suppressor-like RCC1 family protein